MYFKRLLVGQIAKKTQEKNYCIYDVAFESIERIVEERVMQNGDILWMSELTQMFNESLEESGETDVSYRNQKLKNHLTKTFGSRIGFWHPRNRWEGLHAKILSVGQDILYLASHGKVKIPEHVPLPFLVKSKTGSAEIITVLNKLGHGI